MIIELVKLRKVGGGKKIEIVTPNPSGATVAQPYWNRFLAWPIKFKGFTCGDTQHKKLTYVKNHVLSYWMCRLVMPVLCTILNKRAIKQSEYIYMGKRRGGCKSMPCENLHMHGRVLVWKSNSCVREGHWERTQYKVFTRNCRFLMFRILRNCPKRKIKESRKSV